MFSEVIKTFCDIKILGAGDTMMQIKSSTYILHSECGDLPHTSVCVGEFLASAH